MFLYLDRHIIFYAQAAYIRAIDDSLALRRPLAGLPWLTWAPRGSPVLFWARLGSPGLVWALLGSLGLVWALLGSFGLFWARLDSSKVNLVILSLGFMKFAK